MSKKKMAITSADVQFDKDKQKIFTLKKLESEKFALKNFVSSFIVNSRLMVCSKPQW